MAGEEAATTQRASMTVRGACVPDWIDQIVAKHPSFEAMTATTVNMVLSFATASPQFPGKRGWTHKRARERLEINPVLPKLRIHVPDAQVAA